MKKFKLLSTSLIVALSVAAFQASWGMDVNNDEKNNQPIIVKQLSTWSKNTGFFSILSQNVGKKILDMAIYQQAIDTGKSPGNIEATCKVFRDIIANHTKDFNVSIQLSEEGKEKLIKKGKDPLVSNTRRAFLEGLKVHYDIRTQEKLEVFNRIYNGKLIYRPNHNSDEGRVELPISAFKHPFKGEFDLSKCGDTRQYLSINMGYRKKKNPKNVDKVEIWFAPRFLIEKECNAKASHFKPIVDNWKQEQAPVGMFWTEGGWDRLDQYDYLTSSSMDELEIINLLENWNYSCNFGMHCSRRSFFMLPMLSFYIDFILK